MPPYVVLIVCKAVLLPFSSPIDEANAKYTGYQPFAWDTEHSVMHCRRHQIQVYDVSESLGAAPRPFTPFQCNMTGILEGARWNERHTKWKYWKSACPTPIIDTRTGKVLDWKLPECGGDPGTVICEVDTAI